MHIQGRAAGSVVFVDEFFLHAAGDDFARLRFCLGGISLYRISSRTGICDFRSVDMGLGNLVVASHRKTRYGGGLAVFQPQRTLAPPDGSLARRSQGDLGRTCQAGNGVIRRGVA